MRLTGSSSNNRQLYYNIYAEKKGEGRQIIIQTLYHITKFSNIDVAHNEEG